MACIRRTGAFSRSRSPSSTLWGVQPASTFPVCTFKRVFDTTPAQEVLTLSELMACMRRFQLKADLHARIVREIARIDRALEQALSGAVLGERATSIAVKGREASSRGEDPVQAMRARAEELRTDATCGSGRRSSTDRGGRNGAPMGSPTSPAW
jgi:hypothetical protein